MIPNFDPIDIPINLRVELAFDQEPGGSPFNKEWTDVSDDVKKVSGVSENHGRADELAQVQPGTLSFTLDNTYGHYTPNLPASKHYPNIRLGTPVRVTPILPTGMNEVEIVTDTFDREVSLGWGRPGRGTVYVEDNGVSVYDQEFTSFSVSDSEGRYTADTSQAGSASIVAISQQVAFLNGSIQTTIIPKQVSDNDSQFAGVQYREDGYYAALIAFNSSGTMNVQFYTESGTNLISATSLSSLEPYSADDRLILKIDVRETRHRVKVWRESASEPSEWNVDETHSSDDSSSWTAGRVGYIFANSTNAVTIGESTLAVDNLSVVTELPSIFFGQVYEWSPEWPDGDLAENGATLPVDEPIKHIDPVQDEADLGYARVNVTANGPLRGLSQGGQLESAIFRYWTLGSSADDVIAYWPMEDTAPATGFSSPIPNIPDGEIVTLGGSQEDVVDLASTQLVPGSNPTAVLKFDPPQGLIRLSPGNPGQTESINVTWIASAPVTLDNELACNVVFSSPHPSQFETMSLLLDGAGLVTVSMFITWDTGSDQTGGQFDGRLLEGPLIFSMRVDEFFGDYRITLSVYSYDPETREIIRVQESSSGIGLSSSGTVPGIDYIEFSPLVSTDYGIGHVTLWEGSPVFPSLPDEFQQAIRAWYDEPGGDRFSRLSQESNVPVVVTGSTQSLPKMGFQPAGSSLISALQEVATADGGILFGGVRQFGLQYRTAESMFAQQPQLDLNARPEPFNEDREIALPLTPTFDDQRLANRVTASSPDTEATAEDLKSIEDVGVYDGSVTANVSDPDVLSQIASWRLTLGTWPDMRYSNVQPALNRNANLLPTWVSLTLGDRVRIRNLPPQHPTEGADVLAQGVSQSITPESWTGSLNTAPAGLWNDAGVIGSMNGIDDLTLKERASMRMNPTRAYLGEDVSENATSFTVVSAARRPQFGWDMESSNLHISVSPNDSGTFVQLQDFDSVTQSTERAFRGDTSLRVIGNGVDIGVLGTSLIPVHQDLENVMVSIWMYSLVETTLRLRLGSTSYESPFSLETECDTGTLAVSPNVWIRAACIGALNSFLDAPVEAMRGSVSFSSDVDAWIDEFEIGIASRSFIHSGAHSEQLPFEISVAGEVMLVTDITSPTSNNEQTFTVQRGRGGTQRAHSIGADVLLDPQPRLTT